MSKTDSGRRSRVGSESASEAKESTRILLDDNWMGEKNGPAILFLYSTPSERAPLIRKDTLNDRDGVRRGPGGRNDLGTLGDVTGGLGLKALTRKSPRLFYEVYAEISSFVFACGTRGLWTWARSVIGALECSQNADDRFVA